MTSSSHLEARFPHGWDYAWLAIDARGHLAIFTNAGVGPIPASVLVERDQTDETEELLNELPERSGCQMLIALPRPDDYVGFARRGVFAFDWRDAHHTVNKSRRYEMVCRPTVPVSVEQLADAAAVIAIKVRFESLRFEESLSIAVEDFIECYPV
jgi:hypothetical protein